MTTPLRLGVSPLAAVLAAAAAMVAAEPLPLVRDLRAPSAIAVGAGPPGGLRVVVAEADRCTELTVLGQAVVSRRELVPLQGPPPLGLALCESRLLVFDADGVTTFATGPPGTEPSAEPSAEPAAAPADRAVAVAPPAIDTRWLFVATRDGLLRGRVASGRVTKLRGVCPTLTGPGPTAFSPDGYVACLHTDPAGAVRLALLDPAAPDALAADFPVGSLDGPRGLAYAGAGRGSVFALDSTGLRRIDLSGLDRATATLIHELPDAVAMAAAPDGALFVVTRSGDLLVLTGL